MLNGNWSLISHSSFSTFWDLISSITSSAAQMKRKFMVIEPLRVEQELKEHRERIELHEEEAR